MDRHFDHMAETFASETDVARMKKLFSEIFTESEIHDFSLRWGLLEKLSQGMSQREIASTLGISLCKITRGSKFLKNKNSELYKIFSSTEE
ncbi:MAG: transcriptional regulator [Spirochaetes bacterium]|nr:transcriptional regulator [Spirochaetota bacterium]